MRNILLHTLAGARAFLVPVLYSPFRFPVSISCTKLSPSQDATCLELLRWKSTQVQAENINQKPWETENFIVNDKREEGDEEGTVPLPDKSLVNFLGHCLQQALNCLAVSQDDAAGGRGRWQALEGGKRREQEIRFRKFLSTNC